MGWKEDIGSLLDKVDSLSNTVKILVAKSYTQAQSQKRMEAQLEDLHREKSQAVEQMADRLIQMSMVQRGESREASVHRRTAPGHSPDGPSNSNLWGDLPDEAQWPPKNVDVVAQL